MTYTNYVFQSTTHQCRAPVFAPPFINVQTAHSNPKHNNGQLEIAWRDNAQAVLDYENNAAGENPVSLVDPFKNDEQTIDGALADCLRIYQQCKESWPCLDIVGFYNIGIALAGNWNMIRQDQRYVEEWLPGIQIYAQGLNSYVSTVRAICPAFYPPDSWLEDWNKHKTNAFTVVERVIAAIRAWKKPCIAYARPQKMEHRDWREWLWMITDYCTVIVWEDIPQDDRIWKATAQVVDECPKQSMELSHGA